MMRYLLMFGLLASTSFLSASASAEVKIDWATVGDPGNPMNVADPGYGSIKYVYNISKTEVTNAQYTEFLNAVAKTDPHELYNPRMKENANSGIISTGKSGSYVYTVKPGHENKPVVYVSWNDAARFVNWLSNGQGSGDTEKGVYDMSQPMPGRASGAKVFIPSANEWYKAAAYDPTLNNGAGGYYLYATKSNTPPISQPPPGGSNSANYTNDDKNPTNGINNGFAVTGVLKWDSSQDYLTNVGAYKDSVSYYGTFDQCGNVTEWNETVSSDGANRGFQGGHLGNTAPSVTVVKSRGAYKPTKEDFLLGFRVAGLP